ncbi:MAG TPA: sigma-70 family RNA polymerase sigma factor [Burkholderiaceae bacterium]|jgi:RNA polymerase sigma-70 factor (ECF subfamily)
MSSARSFEALVLPHLDAAYNLARWLVRDEHAARDIVQDSCVRALRYFASFRGEQARPWLLAIVRNNCLSWLEAQRSQPEQVELEVLEAAAAPPVHATGNDPLALLEGRRQRVRVDTAIAALAPPFREVIVLREIEGLAYAEIATIADIPVGTVMSRLARARAELKAALTEFRKQD